ncbi:peptidase domain-containing ABC transporter [Glaciecola sp. XM2]|jgi:ATP-binding cassette subfamily B protein RaxB|uniref:peptidase domain-containing ABC transporter n=1 Tax=Glaciecola sp. XM2 TaxID=1914931 RepID=UPI001BDF555F|nr:peptidase domain-containing ABC transporter [Glaciecola sp. XM2]MBT1451461.1 peptidase domain-containing ABC transporter [Glaciecola sp. XM2]
MTPTYQSEAAECGLACMAMIANHHGHKLDLTTLRNQYSVSFKGANMQQLMRLAEQLGMVGRALKLDLDDLKNLKTPCVLHWDMNHFVVLKKVSGSSITILDPALGERKVAMSDVDKSFTGIALELTPTSEFKKKDERVKLGITAFWTRIEGLVPSLIKLFVLSLLLQFFLLATPYYTQLVVDEVLISQDKPLLMVLALGFGLLVLIQMLTQTFRSWVVLHLGAMMSVQMATNLMRHLVHLPLNFFDKRHMGDVVSRFGSLNAIRDLFTNKLIEGVIDGLMAIVVLVMMFLYDTTLALVVLGVVVVYGLIRLALYKPLHQLTEASIMAEAKEQSNFMETVRGMQSIKLFGQQAQRLNLWQNRYTDAVNQNYKLGKWTISYQTINGLLFGIENVVIVYLAAMAVMAGDISVGMLFAFMAYKNQFTNRMAGLIDNLIEIKMTSLHLDRLADIALTDKEQEGINTPSRELSGALSLNNISFRYASNEPLLFNALNLSVPAGANIAIIGPSGTGKTTLMKVMLGLQNPESGKVEADGVDIHHIGLRNYRSQLGAVMQDDQLMSGTLAENISFFDPQMDMQVVAEAAQLAGIHQDISQMNMGYNSLVGDMGSALSGGQKQRLLLARALYRKPKILLLDEATSHLDAALEQYVNHAIQQLPMTRIVIAHRQETILNADVIYQLHEGRMEDVTVEYRKVLGMDD